MKNLTVFYLIAALGVATAFQWNLIFGENLTKKFGLNNAAAAPTCNSDNYYCLIPDYEDPTIFYRCQGIGLTPVSGQCLPGLRFIFSDQSCRRAETWCPPPGPPARCADIPLPCQSTTVSSTSSSSSSSSTSESSTSESESSSSSTLPETTTAGSEISTVPTQSSTDTTPSQSSSGSESSTTEVSQEAGGA